MGKTLININSLFSIFYFLKKKKFLRIKLKVIFYLYFNNKKTKKFQKKKKTKKPTVYKII